MSSPVITATQHSAQRRDGGAAFQVPTRSRTANYVYYEYLIKDRGTSLQTTQLQRQLQFISTSNAGRCQEALLQGRTAVSAPAVQTGGAREAAGAKHGRNVPRSCGGHSREAAARCLPGWPARAVCLRPAARGAWRQAGPRRAAGPRDEHGRSRARRPRAAAQRALHRWLGGSQGAGGRGRWRSCRVEPAFLPATPRRLCMRSFSRPPRSPRWSRRYRAWRYRA